MNLFRLALPLASSLLLLGCPSKSNKGSTPSSVDDARPVATEEPPGGAIAAAVEQSGRYSCIVQWQSKTEASCAIKKQGSAHAFSMATPVLMDAQLSMADYGFRFVGKTHGSFGEHSAQGNCFVQGDGSFACVLTTEEGTPFQLSLLPAQ